MCRQMLSQKKVIRPQSARWKLWTQFFFVFRSLIPGGGAPEIHVSRLLSQHAQTLKGIQAYCFQAFAEALEIIPSTLAENAGLNPIAIVTELRNRHTKGERNAGVNVRKVRTVPRRLIFRLRSFKGLYI
jgi:chaperonin GroEL (HSP60 family)